MEMGTLRKYPSFFLININTSVAIRHTVTGLPRNPAPYEHRKDRSCGFGALPLRHGRQPYFRMARRSAYQAWNDRNRKPQAADGYWSTALCDGHHWRRGSRDWVCFRHVDIGCSILQLRLLGYVVVARERCGASELYRLAWCDYGFRRVHWRRACPYRDRSCRPGQRDAPRLCRGAPDEAGF